MAKRVPILTLDAESAANVAQIYNQLFPTITKQWATEEPPRQRIKKPVVVDNVFTPKTFNEYIGQSEAKELARIMVQAAKKESRPLPNAMIVGEYGLGKTTLATLIMQEYGAPVELLDGASVNRAIPSGLVIIDEIHNLDPEVADTLNIHLDQGNLQIIGCTTDSGKLPSAFRSRFRTFYLKPYTIEELTEIISRVLKRKDISSSRLILELIAKRSRFNARQATMNLAFIFDLMAVKNQRTITDSLVNEAFLKLGIDKKGFAERDRLYLASLPEDRPVGLQYLAAMTGIDPKTLEEEIEPYLLRMGMIDRTQRGRLKIRDSIEVYHGLEYRQ